jgi:hypothetical protein
MRTLVVGLLTSAMIVGIGLSACKPGMLASYPDRDRVGQAQKKWCAMLGKAQSPEGKWGYTKECEAVYPTSSASFLARLTTCFSKAYAELGNDMPDETTMMDECTNEVLATSEPGEAKRTALVTARCRRTARCTPISEAACFEAYEELDSSLRLILTSMYNLRAQHEIASCLDDGACDEDTYAAMGVCYDAQAKRRAWFTTMLGKTADVSLVPAN